MNTKRTFFRLADCLECTFSYKFVNEVKKSDGKIFDISAGGLMLLSNIYLAKDKEIEISIKPPLGPMVLKAKIVRADVEWLVTDKMREKYSQLHVKFLDISAKEQNQIIEYIYKCRAERRKARISGRSNPGIIDSGWEHEGK